MSRCTFEQTLAHLLGLVAHARAEGEVEGQVGLRQRVLRLLLFHQQGRGAPHVLRDLQAITEATSYTSVKTNTIHMTLSEINLFQREQNIFFDRSLGILF